MSALEIFQRVRYSEFWDRSFLYVTIAWGDDKKEKSFPAYFPSKKNFFFTSCRPLAIAYSTSRSTIHNNKYLESIIYQKFSGMNF